MKLLNKTKLPEKFRFMDQKGRIQTHGKEGGGNKRIPSAGATLLYKFSMMSMVWNISFVQLGLSAWLCSLPAPAYLLIS